jgi:signal peptidase I
MVFAVIGALTILVSPVAGAFYALVYSAIARGIRKQKFWAAVTGACFAGVPMIAVITRIGEPATREPGLLALGTALLIELIPVLFFILAARDLTAKSRENLGWIGGIVAVVAFWLCLQPFVMPTASMEDTLLPGDRILVETVSPHFGRPPARGDVVVLRYPVNHRDVFIKRIAGVPGDRLRIVNKRLFINGARVDEPYVSRKTEYVDAYRDNFPSEPNVPLYPQGQQMLDQNVKNGEVVVPAGKYFVLGDNRDSSLDSRYWGFVSRAELMGKPLLIYDSNDLAGDNGQSKLSGIITTRWRRLLRPV